MEKLDLILYIIIGIVFISSGIGLILDWRDTKRSLRRSRLRDLPTPTDQELLEIISNIDSLCNELGISLESDKDYEI